MALGLWLFPPFRVVPLRPATTRAEAGRHSAASAEAPRVVVGSFEAAVFAENFWRDKLMPALGRATALPDVLAAGRRDPAEARQRYATQVGIGSTAYYCVRGAGRILSVEKGRALIAVEGGDDAVIALRVGPIFGNALRDGTGLLNVNAFPGLAEFNAVAAELNRLAETRVLEAVRAGLVSGARVTFAGCAEAPESVEAGAPWLVVVPAQLEVR